MNLSEIGLETLQQDEEFILYRGRLQAPADTNPRPVLALSPVVTHPGRSTLEKLDHEFSLKDELDPAWAIRPIALTRLENRIVLLFDDPGGEPLDRPVERPMDLRLFLRSGIALAAAVGQVHKCGLIHKDIKPSNVLANPAMDQAWLKGFRIASRLPRERQSAKPAEIISGTLAYMAPEQTGRMNRSIDSRSDLYALGVTLYELLTRSLPFTASDPMEWVHCHIARQPLTPTERRKDIPGIVSAIIMKLLAKTPEERYQTAAGAEWDMRRCLEDWDRDGCLHDFALGEHDRPDRLLISEKLYGREAEIETLLTAFDRVVKSGTPELVLVSGYSGIGKSSVVNELHKMLVPPRGLFASGKFDQYKRDIPYSTLAQGLQVLSRYLLVKSESELATWRDALQKALGANGRLIIDLVPALKTIIGEQPPISELPPKDAQRRFQLVLRRFIGVFARPEHPLALFLDDLQWLDSATLDVLEDLLTQSDVQHLLMIGAYRENEVNATHPLTRRLAEIRQAGVRINEMKLAPLSKENVAQLISDALQCGPERALPLTHLVYEKTAGNPFFAIQFFFGLEEERLLSYDHATDGWRWDLGRIRAREYTDNVVDLMVAKLRRLPVETQKALQHLACIGNASSVTMLAVVCTADEARLHTDLLAAVRAQLVERYESSYKFIHDRVREAAYSLLPEAERAETHLRVGRLLRAHTPPEERDDAIFEIVNQLNRSIALITSPDELEELAELNLIAGKRAKASTAYVSALSYFVQGTALLAGDCRERRNDLAFALELNRAECEYVTGQLELAEERLNALSMESVNTVDNATVACLRIDLYTTLGRIDRSVDVCLTYLRQLGIDWSPHPTEEEARREYERVWFLLGRREIEDIMDLPIMNKPEIVATLDVMAKVLSPASFTDVNLISLLLWRMVNLSLENGNTDASCYAYVRVSAIAGLRFGNYKAGFRFGQVGYDLIERRGLKRFQARTVLGFALFTVFWTRHLRAGRDLIRRGFDSANTIGDLTQAAYSWQNLVANLLASGDPLPDVQREAERGIEFAEKACFGAVIDIVTTQLALIRTLRGLTATFGCFNGANFDESQFELHLARDPALAYAACWYWTLKLKGRYFAGDYAAAVEASFNAQRLLWTSPSCLVTAEAHFYGALSHAASCDAADSLQYRQHIEALGAHHKQLSEWAENSPENYQSRAALVGAEIARAEGRDIDAMHLYEKAIDSARVNGFINNEGIAYEHASDFYRTRGFDTIANYYLRNARSCYLSWGAEGKVRQLDQKYPSLKQESPTSDQTGAILAPGEVLDLATVIKVSQAVSGEMVPGKLIDKVLCSAIEHAGAVRALLFICRGDQLDLQAEGTVSGNDVRVYLQGSSSINTALPESLVRYVIRTREAVILEDALSRNPFDADPYIVQHRPRSVLCLPVLNQARLTGVLYLENNLTDRVFTPDRITLLKVLASQAAISLENMRLYRDLVQREARIRHLVDANIIGIYIIDLEGQIIEANDAFLQMLGYERDDLVSGRLRWTDLTPPEWHAADAERLERVKQSGSLQPFEKEYQRKDGRRVPVLVGVARFEEAGDQAVVFAIDLSERKRAEDALRASERELRSIIDTVPTLAWSAGPDGIGIFFNARWHEYTGLTPEDVRERGWAVAIHPADLNRLFSYWQSAISSGAPVEIEGRLRRFDGEYRWFLFRANPLYGESGNIIKWYGTNTDIDDLKRAEAGLYEAQRLTHTGSWKLDVSSGRVSVSPEIFRIFDATPDENISSPDFWFGRIHADDRQRAREHFERCVAAKVDYEDNYRIVLPNGSLKYVHSIGHLNLNDSGSLVEVLGTAIDVTEQVHARLKLESAFEEIKQLKDRLQEENVALRELVDRDLMFEEIVGTSAALTEVLSRVAKVAATDSTVLLTGETGTGKELIARAIHKTSQRSSRAFIGVNCAAIPDALITSELFGHEKGAFTGALQRRLGRFEMANGGTLFLDEVGDLPLDTQAAFLRVLQERELERLGGVQSIPIDVRVIAATNRDLKDAVARGSFRQDLYYRLNVFPIELPPLRKRKDDLPMLVAYFVDRYARRAGKSFRSIEKKTLELIQAYDWPGNVRELQNIIERSTILSSREVFSIDESWLAQASSRGTPAVSPQESNTQRNPNGRRQGERETIEAALAECRGRVSGPSGAAAKLRIPSSTLESRIKALNIRKSDFKFG